MPELDDRESLRDLDGIRIEVDALPSLVATQGLSAERLKDDVEGRLRGAGVKVLPMGAFRSGDPHLHIVVRLSRVEGRMVASQVEVNFVQVVFLRRNPLVTFNRARTWNSGPIVSLGPAAHLAATIRREISRQVDHFIADYRHVNP